MNLLDNPIWNALRTEQSYLALGDDRARRYPADIGPLAGVAEETPGCYEALHALLAGPADILAVFSLHQPRPIPGWNLFRSGALYQMIRTTRVSSEPAAPGLDLRILTAADAPAMVALAEATEPGPFRLRTLELGTFYGIFHDGRLVSMAGKRMHLPGFVEVSGVCTYPEARGRGYARLLMSLVIDEIELFGETPFLHVLTENPAVRLYQALGFQIRQTLHYSAIRSEDGPPDAPASHIH
jgi:predicted GNAT family acetyltransferase